MFCLKCGAELIERTVDGEARHACSRCPWVFFNNPVPIAGTIVTHDGGILLVQRQVDPPDRYALVAGYLEAFESAEEAAVREVKEETNLDVVVASVVGIYSCRTIVRRPTPESEERMNAIFIVQHAEVAGGELRLAPELRDAKYFTPQTLPRYPAHWPIAQAFKDWLQQRT